MPFLHVLIVLIFQIFHFSQVPTWTRLTPRGRKTGRKRNTRCLLRTSHSSLRPQSSPSPRRTTSTTISKHQERLLGRASKAPQISTGATAKTPAALQLEKKQLQAQLKTYGERIGTFLDGLATQAGTPREIKDFLQMVKVATKTHVNPVSVGRNDAFGKLALSYHPAFSRSSTLTTLSKPTSTLTTSSYSSPLTSGDVLLPTPSFSSGAPALLTPLGPLSHLSSLFLCLGPLPKPPLGPLPKTLPPQCSPLPHTAPLLQCLTLILSPSFLIFPPPLFLLRPPPAPPLCSVWCHLDNTLLLFLPRPLPALLQCDVTFTSLCLCPNFSQSEVTCTSPSPCPL